MRFCGGIYSCPQGAFVFLPVRYNKEYMNDDEESSSLHSIERSNVSGIKRRSAARRVRISREQRNPEQGMHQQPPRRPSGRQAPRRSSRPMGPPRRPMSRRRRGSVKKILVVLLVTIAVLLTLLTLTFATARLDLVLETADVEVDGVFSAIRDPPVPGTFHTVNSVHSVRNAMQPLQTSHASGRTHTPKEPSLSTTQMFQVRNLT